MGKIVRVKASELKKPTAADIKRLREVAKRPIVFDEECPETTKEELALFRRRYEEYKINNKKVVFSLRITQKSMNKLKSLGPGYSTIVSNMIEYCLNNPDILKKCL